MIGEYQGSSTTVDVPIAPVSATRAALLARLGPLVALRPRHAEAGSDADERWCLRRKPR